MERQTPTVATLAADPSLAACCPASPVSRRDRLHAGRHAATLNNLGNDKISKSQRRRRLLPMDGFPRFRLFGTSWLVSNGNSPSQPGQAHVSFAQQDKDVMRQLVYPALWATLLIFLGLAGSSRRSVVAAEPADVVGRARLRIEADDPLAAVTLLEDSLPDATDAERPAILDLLRHTYPVLIEQAQKAGRHDEADLYRDNLAILEAEFPAPPSAPKSAPVDPAVKPAGAESQTQTQTNAGPQAPAAAAAEAGSQASSPSSNPTATATPSQTPEPRVPGFAAEPKPAASDTENTAPSASPGPAGSAGAAASPTTPPPSASSAPASLPSPSGAPVLAVSPEAKAAEEIPSLDNRRPAGAGTGMATGSGAGPSNANPKADDPLARADRAFREGKYPEAGQLFAELARQNRLPVSRKELWAYCRWVELVRRINAGPRSDREWDAIEAEIQSVRRLNPNNWYGEYLRSRVAEARRSRRPAAAPAGKGSGKLVVRGANPDEPEAGSNGSVSANTNSRSRLLPFRRRPTAPSASRDSGLKAAPAPAANAGATAFPFSGASRSPALSPPAAPGPEAPLSLPPAASLDEETPARSATPGVDPESIRRPEFLPPPAESPSPGSASSAASAMASPAVSAPVAEGGDAWQILETDNFRVFHHDPELAAHAGEAAEAVRRDRGHHWGSTAAQRPWVPRCDLYLYPDAKTFARMTGQAETSPGFSSTAVNGSRVISRRVNLRADHPQMLTAILPHEVTHVVLNDLFPSSPIPRWADEGMAVLSEPAAEQDVRAIDLDQAVRTRRLFSIANLTQMDHPLDQDWPLYYSQSVSLTRFLVEQADAAHFVAFLQASQREGVEPALQSIYQINSLSELQDRWLNYATRQAEARSESAPAEQISAAGTARDAETR
jgi:hypothetical protein